MESNEFFNMAVNRGAAIVQIAVTSPVVIKTTRTQPGTSPLSSFNLAKNESCFLISVLRNVISARTTRSVIEFIDPPINVWSVMPMYMYFCEVREFLLTSAMSRVVGSIYVDKHLIPLTFALGMSSKSDRLFMNR
jgi:hypothetical protein